MFPCAAFLYAQDEWYRALAHASRTWPTVHGVVQESKGKSKLTQYGTLYRLALSYRYEVGRDGYDGDMAEFGPSWVREKELIEAFAEKYPPAPRSPCTTIRATPKHRCLRSPMRWREKIPGASGFSSRRRSS